MSRFRDFRICSGRAHPSLAQNVADQFDVELGDMDLDRFADGEIRVQFQQTVRGVDVFLVQPTCRPVNEHLMELLLMIDAAQRASAARITAVIPYFGYARQDRKDQPRVPISAKMVANLLEEAGADRILTLDLHADQIQGFFDVPVDHLYARPVLIDYLSSEYDENGSVIVSPDAGSVNNSRSYATRLGMDLAIVDKRRPEPNQSEVRHIIGDVEGKNCIIIDDMIDTGGTLTSAADAISEAGANSVVAAATHPVFSEPAVRRIKESALESVTVLNTIPVEGEDRVEENDVIEVLDCSELLSDAIRCIHEEQSIRELFD
jgi:ribose-phosphate pyrophosphokinase